MEIDKNWSFKDLVYNLQALKETYDIFLALFLSCDNSLKPMNDFIRKTKKSFYALNIKEWQIDICWEYMNGYKLFCDIEKIFKRIDKTNI